MSSANALGPGYEACFKRELKFLISKHAPYKWGGYDPEKGLDCTHFVFLAGKWAGLPGIRYTQSRDMAQGLGGWIGGDILRTQAHEGDLAFFTWHNKPFRVDGHVGVLLDKDGELGLAHAGSRGVGLVKIRGVLDTDMSRVRHLTIGE